ncbi:SRPBCC domain-containing protein [Cohnella zeiphila]|nr:SRPBCC domain-containing protein [Cohnella zeiphila]
MALQVEITHTFHASRELVFQAFTTAEHLQNWWGPKGWAFEVSEADFRSGGVFHYSQKPDDGDVMWVKFEYGEIDPPEKIVYTSYFSDEAGNVVRAPFDANWPMRILNTMTFAEDEGQTTITLITAPVSPTEEEAKTFEASHDIMREGFGSTFKELDTYLAKK